MKKTQNLEGAANKAKLVADNSLLGVRPREKNELIRSEMALLEHKKCPKDEEIFMHEK